jgi:hypothetical protein
MSDCHPAEWMRSPQAPGGILIKVGALDDPGLFGGPDRVIWTEDKQDFHVLPEGGQAFPRLPGRQDPLALAKDCPIPYI